MQLTDWLASWLSRGRTNRRSARRAKSRHQGAHGAQAAAERLEPRSLPTVLTVTSLADTVVNDGQVTLREAIQAANTDTTVDGVTGSGTDTIQFAPSLTTSGPATITLNGSQLSLTSDLTINGPGLDRLTIDANNRSGIFEISSGRTIAINSLMLTGGNNAPFGGAISNFGGSLTVSNCKIVGNTGSRAGAISNQNGQLTVSDSELSGNVSDGPSGGGAIYSDGGSLLINRALVANNSTRFGGGIYGKRTSQLIVKESTISGNTSVSYAGGIFSDGSASLVIDRSTISGNQVMNGAGGGVTIDGPSNNSQSVVISQTTISDNVATGHAGLLISNVGSLQLQNCTIVGNRAYYFGGGMYAYDLSKATLTNTIVLDNTINGGIPDDLTGSLASTLNSNSRNNLIGDPNHAGGLVHGVNGNIVGQSNGTGGRMLLNPMTVLTTTLADNGGPTKTHSLVSGSPAIDAGDSSQVPTDAADLDADGNMTEAVPFDQRGSGFARVVGSSVDIGAVAFGVATPPAVPSQPTVTVTVSRNSVKEDGTENIVFTLSRDLTAGALTVNLRLNGSAIFGTDYSARATNSVTFPDGVGSVTVTIDPTADVHYEEDESVSLVLLSGVDYQVGKESAASRTILNDDAILSVINLVPFESILEGNSGESAFNFRVVRDGDSSGAVTVNYTVTGSGTNPADAADFGGAMPNGVITLTPNEPYKTFTIYVSGDTISESNETFTVTLSNAVGADISATYGARSGTILADEPEISISATDASKNEGNSGSTPFVFTVTRTGDTSGAASVNYTLTGSGTKPVNASDFGGTFPSGTVSFAAGESSKTITINVRGDTAVESNEGFTVTLSNAVGATLGSASTTGTIRNDDDAFAISGYFDLRTEGSRSDTPFRYTVTRTGNTTNPSSVNYVVAGSGSDPADAADFGGTFPSGTVSFAAGQTEATLYINVAADSAFEPNETFNVTISRPTGGAITGANASGMIYNDDAAPISNSPSTLTYVVDTLVDESDGNFSAGDFSLREAIERANATAGTQTIAFAPALTASGTAAITLGGTQLLITSDLIIDGPGARQLTIDGDHRSRIFKIDDGANARLSVVIRGVTLANGDAGGYYGGAIDNRETLTVALCTIRDNVAYGGGGISTLGADTTVIQSTLSNNTVIDRGGAIHVDGGGVLTVSQSTINGNSANVYGGGVFVELVAGVIEQSTIFDNACSNYGAGVMAGLNETTITQSTIANNRGRGVYTSGGMSLAVKNSILVGNNANGGVDFENDTRSEWSIANSLVGTLRFVSGLANGVNGNIVGASASSVLSATLTDAGGATKVLPLISGSPAINSGDSALIPPDRLDVDGDGNTTELMSFDQRGNGYARVSGARVDMGAVEFGSTYSPIPFVTVAVSPPAVTEDASGNLIFTLTRDLTAGPLTVNFSLSGSATAGTDYSADSTNSATFADGASTVTVTVDPTSDSTLESNETVIATVLSGTGYLVGSISTATGTITNDDTTPTLSIAAVDSSKLEGNSGTTQFTFAVTRTGNSSGAAGASFAVIGSGTNPANPADFGGSFPSGTISFAAGETSKTITVNITGDTSAEPEEGFTVTLSNVAGADLTMASATGTILDDDATMSIAATNASRLEGNSGNTAFTFTATRTGDVSGSASADFTVAGVSANAADFGGTLPNGTISFAAGQTASTITINVSGDTAVEPNETFTVTLSNVIGIGLGTATATGTIRNDDSALSIAATSASNLEGNSGSVPFTFTVTRTGTVSGAASAGFAVTGSGSNAADAADFGGSLSDGTINFAVGETFKTISINVTGDTTGEFDEGFTVTLSNANGANLGTTTATGTIVNDDASLSIAATDASKSEGNTGSAGFAFTVTRTGDTSGSASANFAVTGSGTNAANASDFGGTLPSGTINFAAGEMSKTITVNVSSDTAIEPDEGFTVTLSNVTGAALGTSSASGTILNDDASLSISATSASKVEGNSGSAAFTFTVTRTGNTNSTASVDFAVTGSGANSADALDFGGTLPSGTISFAVGETSKTITVDVSSDTINEDDEGFAVTLSNPSSGAAIISASAEAVILNDDVVPTPVSPEFSIAAASASKSEGAGGSTEFTFTVSRSGDSNIVASVDFAVTGNGSNAADAADFGGTLPNGTISFAEGESSKTITVNVSGDVTTEADESFSVTLSNAVGAGLKTSLATGTILNDDASLSIAAASAVKPEGNSGSTAFTFTVTRGGDASGSASVDFTVSDSRTDGAGTDSQPTVDAADFGGAMPSGTISFAVGESSKTITVNVSGDSAIELDEEFLVALSNVTGASLETDSATGTIRDDDYAALRVAVDADGNLTLTDNGHGRGNDITVAFDSVELEYEISSPIAESLTTDNSTFTNSVRVSASRVTRGLIANMGDGDDRLDLGTINLPATVQGGAGNDTIKGSIGLNVIDGGDGHDLLIGGLNRDTLTGDAGNDSLLGGGQADSLSGGDGNDVVDGQGNSGDIVEGDAGDDTLKGGSGLDIIRGGEGQDTYIERQDSATVPLTITLTDSKVIGLEPRGEETLNSIELAIIETGSGNDRIDTSAFTGSVTLQGGRGDDTLIGGNANDVLNGDYGADSLDGRMGRDYLTGGNGDDRLQGGGGDDTLDAGDGDDTLLGNSGDDLMRGGAGNDYLSGHAGNDTLLGSDGNDTLLGGEDLDWLLGEAGQDLVKGEAGIDRLAAGGNGIAMETGDRVVGDVSEFDELLGFNFNKRVRRL